MLSHNFAPTKDIRKAIGLLNSSKVMEKNINPVGMKKEDLYKAFMDAVQAIPKEEHPKVAKEVFVLFNTICNENDPTPEELAKVEEDKKKAKKQNEGKGVPKNPTGISNEDRMYGLVKAGTADDKILAEFTSVYQKMGQNEADYVKKRVKIYRRIADKKIEKEKLPTEGGNATDATLKETAPTSAPTSAPEAKDATEKPKASKETETPPPATEGDDSPVTS